jgi:hypothetical protein
MINGSWSRDDLVRRLRNSLRTAERAVRILGRQGFTDPDDPTSSVRPEKLVAETAVLLLAAGPISEWDNGVGAAVADLAQLLIPLARSEEICARVCLEPSLARSHALGHACLTRLGYPDADLDRLLGQALHAQAASGHERPPHRQLEQEWLARVWDPSGGALRSDPGLLRRSILAHSMDALSASRDDVYAFTHAVLYSTDLGRRSIRLPRPIGAIMADAEAALGRCLVEHDYDLAGEVLLTWPLLRQPWSAAASFGFTILASVEDQAGFLPAPILRLERYRQLKGEERSRYALASLYHTSYVMGLLCAAALRPGCSPPAAVRPLRRATGAAHDILDRMDIGGDQPHWVRPLADLRPRQQDAVAPLLLSMCLRQAVSRRDLGMISRTLDLAARCGILDGPSPHQAVQLLQRGVTLSSLAGFGREEDSVEVAASGND